ncbi:GspH/FimT family pseudopilin [Halopseudomonas yangmingensis]|uniref:Type II secretion system protein H n=1 Tax=Halopseudomonas yangmingensis TaxID=1720063 RepID=A0A1I4P025_9GAMM|nr:GspH/FimT family pseudopilin [Halopseudomonas yangmingensis]SFM21079.1 type IV fimbrial biogenesis protein FimT [Halopseudomonas yangmingensis]
METSTNNGFTLIELLVALAILGLALGIGLPSLDRQIEQRRLDVSSTLLQGDLAFARQQALADNRAVTVGAAGGWQDGWRVFVDRDGDGRFGSGDLLLRSQSAQPVHITGNSSVAGYVRYNGLGESQTFSGAFQAGTLLLCPAKEAVAGRSLVINRSGRVRSERLPAGDPRCAGS